MTLPRFMVYAFVALLSLGFGFQIGISVKGYQDENIVNDALGTGKRLSIEEAAWRASHIILECRDYILESQQAVKEQIQ